MRMKLVVIFILSSFLIVHIYPVEKAIYLTNDTLYSLKAPLDKMVKERAPKLLYKKYNFSYEPYVQVYRFKVNPGQKYTFYMYHPAKGVSMNAYLRGNTPLTDYTWSYGPSGYLWGFVCWGQQPRKSKCPYKVRRYNFRIAEKSENPWLYLVATYAEPGVHFKVRLQSKADPDQDVKTNKNNPYCADQKYYNWGTVWRQDLILTNIPKH